MKDKKFVFVGDRCRVLEELLNLDLNVIKIFCVKGSFLERDLISREIDYELLESRDAFIDKLKNEDFDVLISNGCPYILPVFSVKKDGQIFVNLHPSLLPDLRGKSPINGVFLFEREAGATCHLMNDEIDAGRIISQVKVDNSEDLDLGLLYNLCFMAEAEAFRMAYENNFAPMDVMPRGDKDSMYYSRQDEDMFIDFSDDVENIVRKIKAFGVDSQGAWFNFKGNVYKILDIKVIKNKYLLSKIDNYREMEIVFFYAKNIVVRKGDVYLNLKNVFGDLSKIREGDILLSH